MLLSIIKRGDKDFASTTKRRKKDDSPLLRPIICICNDLYVPALRQLRQQALVITIPQTASPTLASRLLEVCMDFLSNPHITVCRCCDKSLCPNYGLFIIRRPLCICRRLRTSLEYFFLVTREL